MLIKLLGMVFISALWLVSASACMGISMLALRALQGTSGRQMPLLDHFWIGLPLVLCGLQVTSLLFPINGYAAIAVLLIGFTGLGSNTNALRRQIRLTTKSTYLLIAAIALFALWLANQAMAGIQTYDAGLYHTSAIRWASEFPVTRGLGNLHGRLAFNSSYFLYHALFADLPIIEGSFNVGSGLLILMLTLHLLACILKVLRKDHALAPSDLYLVAAFPVVADTWFNDAASTSPDLPARVLVILIGFYMWRIFGEDQWSVRRRESFFILALLSALAMTVKLSTAAFAGSAILIAAFKGFRSNSEQATFQLWEKSFLVPVAGIGACLLPWILRGYLLSGYPFFPAPFGRADFPWSVADVAARSEQTSIMTWAREPGGTLETLQSSDWIAPWWDRTRSHFQFPYQLGIPFVLAVLGLPLIVVRVLASRARRRLARNLTPLIPPVISLAAWWVLAPDPRYLACVPWYLATSMLLVGLTNLRMATARRLAMYALLLSLALALPILIRSDKFIPPGPSHGFYPLPQPETATFLTLSGLALQVPEDGDQCWDSGVLCTPSPNPKLTLLSDGRLKSGFAVFQSND